MSVSPSPEIQPATLAESRLSLAPEINRPPEFPEAPAGPFGEVRDQGDIDLRMWDLVAEVEQAKAEPALDGLRREAADGKLEQGRKTLRHYRDYRLQRGERPFQYLDKAQRRADGEVWRKNLPALVGMFSGPDKITETLPVDQRQVFEDTFKNSIDPEADKIRAANMQLVSLMTGKPVDDIEPVWEGIRGQYAASALGISGPVDDARFYQAAGSRLAKEKADGEMMERIHARSAVLAIQGKPLADSLAETRKLAGDRWKEFAPAARQGHASALAKFSDREITVADTLWERFQRDRFEVTKSESPEAASLADALAAYGKMTQAQRENLMGVIALRARDEGEDVTNFFARFGQAFKSGMYLSAVGLAAMDAAGSEDKLRKFLEKGKVPASIPAGEAREIPVYPLGTEMRPLTAEERKYFETLADMEKGHRAMLTDFPNAGIKSRRYLDDERNGFWDTLGDTVVMAGESLPLMGTAALPYGGGLLLNAAAYAEADLATLRAENPTMDSAAMERTAYASSLAKAGIDRLQIGIMGARLPKVTAWAYRQNKLLRVPLVVGIKTGISGGAETLQEVGQDLTLPAVTELAAALSDDIEGPDWAEVLEKERQALGDIARVSLLFGIVGGAGHTIADVMDAPKLREVLTDREGLAVAGHTPETIEKVATEAETNPLAAAETLKAAVMETPVEVRRANSKAAVETAKANPQPSAQEAALPEIIDDEDGLRVRYPDGTEDPANSMEDAVAAMRVWEQDESNLQEQGIRQYLRHLEGYHEGNPELAAKGTYTGREVSFADWSKGSKERLDQAHARVRIAMKQAGLEMSPEETADLSAYLILGSSRNTFGQGVTRIAMEVNKAQQDTGRAGATVMTPIEEHAEGIGKWLMETGKKSEDWFIQNIRATESATKAGRTMAENLMDMTPEARRQEVAEAFSRLAVANATGKVQDSQLPAGLKAVFRAIKETIHAILQLASDIKAFRDAGKMDSEFGYWLDVAGGVNEDYYGENMVRQMEADMIAESMEGMPEIKSSIAGKLPHPETLEKANDPLAGEVRAIYEEIKQSQESGANQAARTRKANEFFLPVGKTADLDKVRESINEQGFDFQTPAEMLDSLMLSIGFGKPQYGTASNMDQGWESFSIAPVKLTAAPYTETGVALRDKLIADLGNEVPNAYTGWEIGFYKDGAKHIVNQNKGEARRILPHLKELVESSAWLGRRPHRDSEKPRGLRWQHLFYAPYETEGGMGIARFVVNETWQGERLIDAKASDAKKVPDEFTAGGGENRQRTQIGPPGRMTMRQLRGLVKSLWPDDPATLSPPANDRRDGTRTFSIARADSPLLTAIDALVVAPEKKAEVYQRMAAKVREIRQRFDKKRLSASLMDLLEDDDPNARHEMLRDIATLEAVAKVLPPAIRGKLVGSFRQLEKLKTAKGREDYMIRLLPRIEAALENHLQNQFRMAIRREFDRAAIKVSESKTRVGKIGAAAHAIVEEARKAMKLMPEQAEATAEKLRDELENSPSLTAERLEELDGRIAALELFQDFDNADSVRLEEGLKLLKDVYRDGRREWLMTLAARRDLRMGRIELLKQGLNMDHFVTDYERNRGAELDKNKLRSLDEGIMEYMLGNFQKIGRLAELTNDPAVRAVVEEFETAVMDAELAEADANHADQKALGEAMRRIFGVSTEYGVARKLRELTAVSEKDQIPVTKIEGFKEETVKVPKLLVESLLRGEVSGFTDAAGNSVELDAFDVAALEKAWDEFSEMEESDQNRRRQVLFTRRVSDGNRITLGALNQLEALQLWLTMRQPDQAAKMEYLGYDSDTMAEMEAWLKPETKALGLWMVEHLKADQQALDEIHRSEKGVGLALVDEYFPIRNDVSGADNSGMTLDGNTAMQGGRSVSSLKERVTNYAKPAKVNAIGVFLQTRAQVNFWKAHVSLMREWGGVIRDDGMASAIKVRMGETYFNSLKRTMDRIESGGSLSRGGMAKVERWMKQMMKTNALGVLGMRASTIFINLTAALNVAFEVRADHLVKGMLQVIKRPESFKDAWNSPAIRRRLEQGATFEATVGKASGPSQHPLLAILNSTAEKGMFPINLADTGANLIGAAVVWEITHKEALRAGLDPEAAKAMADAKVEKVLLRAAQPTTRLARSEFEQRVLDFPLAAPLALFISEPRKNLAITYLALRELATGKGNYGKVMSAQRAALGLVGMSAASYLMKSLYDAFFKAKDDEEDEIFSRFWAKMTDGKAWAYAMSSSHLRAFPLIGEAWNALMAKTFDQPVFDKSPNPVMKLKDVPGNLADAFGDVTAEERARAFAKISQNLGSTIPGAAVVAQGGNIAEFGINAASAGGFEFSDADRLKRFKTRYHAASKALDKQLGKTTGPDGKIRKDVQAKKQRALADKLRAELSILPEPLRKQALESVPEAIREMIEST